jgi:tripartite-type tricarboxylate transporter receptor subunit TctC
MELLKYMAGVDITHVPYRGTAAAVTDVISGQIQLAFATALTAKPQVDAGRVRALAVSGPRRVDALPNVPPVAEAVPGYEAMQWYGLLAPAGVSNAVVDKLNAEALVALRSKEMKDRLAADGAEPLGSSPAEFGAFIRRELDKWNKVAEAAKIEKQ